MGKHVAIIGAGRLGSSLGFLLSFEPFVEEITLVDIIPSLARMVGEDILHGVSHYGIDKKINAYETSREVEEADMIIITAGAVRKPNMSRRELAEKNAKIVKQIIEDVRDNNPKAWYLVVTNPVDALSTLVSRLIGRSDRIIGTGTSLETSRFKTILSKTLNEPISNIEAYVGGEHGEDAVLLWSLVSIRGKEIDLYLQETGKTINREMIEEYVKNISSEIIQAQGATIWGPVGTFLEIIRGIFLNTGKILCFSTSYKFDEIPEPVHVSVPTKIGKKIGPSLWEYLSEYEKNMVLKAAKSIYDTYLKCLKSIEKGA